MTEYSSNVDVVAAALMEVARMAHEVNRAYCVSIGDHSQVPWEEAPQWQKESAVKGVMNIARNPETGPVDSHASWLETKINDGWIWGPTKNGELATHPCMVPFDELPPEQQIKDHLFVGTVKALLRIKEGA